MHTADWTWKDAADERNVNIGKYDRPTLLVAPAANLTLALFKDPLVS